MGKQGFFFLNDKLRPVSSRNTGVFFLRNTEEIFWMEALTKCLENNLIC